MQQGKWLARYKRHIEALACYDQLLAIQPGNYKAHSHRGEALVALGRHADGLDAYRRALTLKPDHVGAHVGIGDALRDLGQHEAAIAAFDRAIAIFPDNPDLLSGALFNINYSGSFTPAEILARHRHYGELVEIPLRANWQVHTNTPDPARPIRVGFVSGDLRRHPVGYFMENVFHELAKAPLELYAYANQPQDDDLTARIRPCFKCWRDIFDHTDDSVATQIRADGIDILVDLSGHTGNHRLKVFARKPAPVQVTYLGYFASTGLSAMDYILGNRWLMPDGDPEQYTERPYRLPDAHLCFTPPSLDIAVKPPPALANGYVTFGNFNALAKMTDNVVACWADILHAVPDSRLLLKSPPLDATDVREQVLQRFAVHGIADDRLLLEGRSDYANYFACYHKLDIALDPFPYNGGTTTADALWMGVPVLTLQGDRYVARMGTSILKILDLPEWVASSQDDYVARAARLAADVQALATLRAGLRERFVTSPLCDAPRFAANLERAFREMWQAWCTKPGFGFTRGEP
ncbi:MAG: tetratricopeptide repeat protein [Geobacter sp.]|nr:MAG: tetratricopeptide repeat protein [Geobacter sp.]